MRWISARVLLWLCAWAIAPLALASHLIVIADHGGQSARPYYAPIAAAGVDETEAYHARDQARLRGPVTEAGMLPVRSEQLTPGRVYARALQLPAVTTPLFLIGADPLSIRWLKQRGKRLRELHAIGLVVNVDTAAELRQLRQIGQGLMMRAAPGGDIARRLDISHYPVLISQRGIQQ